jgi:hypothetical protein
MANLGTRLWQATRPYFFKGKKGASQQKSWPTWVLDFGKLRDPIFNGNPTVVMANMGTRRQASSILQAPAVLANEGTRHCRQATYCKPQRSWPMRARGITGKQCIVFQEALAVLANESSRHRGRATSFDSKPQRSGPMRALDITGKLCRWWQSCKRVLMGRRTTMPEWRQQEGFFCLESNSTWRQPW